ncbi:hypothetical protein [Sphingomonas sp. Mn802worker]|uniref:hypothetical protein n=1 Tax=Sphingomonas sp. Mn802worker TaxID=629773 RepID=UPI000370414B|nr:hypothetical protein [Sphingomonas sp. Mn802worker]
MLARLLWKSRNFAMQAAGDVQKGNLATFVRVDRTSSASSAENAAASPLLAMTKKAGAIAFARCTTKRGRAA